MVASMMPGSANTIEMSCSCSHRPNQPCSPNSSTNNMPEITGEIASGRSMRVMSDALAVELELGDRPGRRESEQRVDRHHYRGGGERQAHGGRGIRVGKARQIRYQSAGERHGEHGSERGEQQRREEGERHRDEQPAHYRMHPGVLAGTDVGVREPRLEGGSGHQRPVRTRRRRPHACSRLMVSSTANDMSSITSPSAAAPW